MPSSKKSKSLKLFILFTGIGTLWLASLLPLTQIKKSGDATVLLNSNDPEIEKKRHFESLFGSANVLIISTDRLPGDGFEGFSKVADAHQILEQHAAVRNVWSAYSAPYSSNSPSGFVVADLLMTPPADQQDWEAFQQKIADQPNYFGSVISLDGNNLNIVVEFHADVADPDRVAAVRQVLVDLEVVEDWRVSGLPKINSAIVAGIDEDLMLLVPLFIIVVSLILWQFLGSILAVCYSLVAIFFTLSLTLATLSLGSVTLNVVTNNIPMLILSIGGACCIHFFSALRESDRRREPWSEHFRRLRPSLVLAALTTAVGFLANLSSSVAAVRQFGWAMAAGMCFLTVSSLIILPLLVKWRRPEFRVKKSNHRGMAIRLIRAQKIPFLWAYFAMASAVAIWSLTQTKAEYKTLGYFSEDSSVVSDARFLSANYGGYSTLDLVVSGPPESMASSSVLTSIDDLSQWAQMEWPETFKVHFSMADFTKDLSRAFNDAEEFWRVPLVDDAIYQYWDVYSWSRPLTEDFSRFIDEDWSKLRISYPVSLEAEADGGFVEKPVQEHNAMLEALAERLRSALPAGLSVDTFGEIPIWARVNRDVVRDQLYSVVLAIAFVWLILLIVFRDISLSFLGLSPVVFAVLMNFLAMKVAGWHLDLATSLVSAMAIGIGIDDCIHFLLRYRQERKSGAGVEVALEQTLSSTGKAIVGTSIALIVGYSLFVFSGFKPVATFGILNGITIFSATIATLFLLPWLIRVFAKRGA